MNETTVLFCHCANSGVVPEDVKGAVHEGLVREGRAVEYVADLCGLSARRDPLLKRLSSRKGIRIAACYPPAVRWLFHAGGAELPADVELLNMREEDAETVLDRLNRAAEGDGSKGSMPDPTEKGEWVPWFPVIDYDRCTGCMQCLKFCLFGVFQETEDELPTVVNPMNCKINCPACARVCPEAAIIFPKHETGPINGSDEAPDTVGERSGIGLEALLKGDLYEMLRSRGDEPCSLPEAALLLAEQERKRCACDSGGMDASAIAKKIMSSACGCEGDGDGERESERESKPDSNDCSCNDTDTGSGCCEEKSGRGPDKDEKGPCCGE